MTPSTQNTRTHVGRSSKSNLKGTILNITSRAILTIIVAIIALTTFALPAAAAPSKPELPAGLTQLGSEEWNSGHIQKTNKYAFKDFVVPTGTVYMEVQITWIPDNKDAKGTDSKNGKDGKGNETAEFDTSKYDYRCLDADLVNGNNDSYLCANDGFDFTGDLYQVTVKYAGEGGLGDSHGYHVVVTFYGLDQDTPHTFTTNSHPHFNFGNPIIEDKYPDTTPSTTPSTVPSSLPNTGDNDGYLPLAIAAIAVLLIGFGATTRFLGKSAS